MSFTTARARQQAEPESSGVDRSFMCRVHGCGSRWTVDMLNGKVCSFHDSQFATAHTGKLSDDYVKQGERLIAGTKPGFAIPVHEAVRPFCEPAERGDF